MAKFLFVYHGGSKPEDPAAMDQAMQDWGNWFAELGNSVIDGGNPVGLSSTVNSDGTITNNGGSNPASGYSLIEAASLEDVIAKAQGCPILSTNGSVELAEAIELQPNSW